MTSSLPPTNAVLTQQRPGVTLESLRRQPTLVTIGNFDGVHLGHQSVLRQAAASARDRALIPVALTFDPHPTVAVGRPPPACLTSLDRKIELMERVDPAIRVVVLEFDAAFAAQTPEQFVKKVLVDRANAQVVRVGDNFRFGSGRAGDLAVLRELGNRFGIQAEAAALVADDRGRYSSTRVRERIHAGELDEAAALLGRPHCLSGLVVQGQMRAREMGFPTANLAWVYEALPPHGVYAVAVDHVTNQGVHRLGAGAANIGIRPTVDAGFAVEVHLLDLNRDLYGEKLRVHLLAFLRPERKFASLQELLGQISQDVKDVRRVLDGRLPARSPGEPWF